MTRRPLLDHKAWAEYVRTDPNWRAPEWRQTVFHAGVRPRLILDEDSETWEAWYQGRSCPGVETVRFYSPSGACFIGGIDEGAWAEISEEDLLHAIEHAFRSKQISDSLA